MSNTGFEGNRFHDHCTQPSAHQLMTDLIFILAITAFFTASELYVRFCGKL